MNARTANTGLALLAAVLALSAPCAVAQDAIGRVLLTKGSVTARDVNGNVRQLTRRAELFEQDIVLTDADGFFSVRLVDDAQLTLGPDTEFKFERYRFDANPATPDAAVMTLVQGCFRTVSGAIGDAAGDDHRIDTPRASISTRGTLHAARFDGDVLYTATYEGGTTVANPMGTMDLGLAANYNFSRTLPGAAPEGLTDEVQASCGDNTISSTQRGSDQGDYSAGPADGFTRP